MLAARHLVEDERPAHRFGRRVPLLFAELLPVDVHLHGIDLLIHEPPDELLHAPIDFAIEQRRGDVEGHTGRELLQQLAARVALRFVRRLLLEVGAHPRPQRVEVLEVPEVLRELVVQMGHDALADRLDRHVVVHGRARELRNRVVPGYSTSNVLEAPAVRPTSCSSKPGGFAGAPISTVTPLCRSVCGSGRALGATGSPAMTMQRLVRGRFRGRGPLEIHQDRVAHFDPALLDRLVSRARARAGP